MPDNSPFPHRLLMAIADDAPLPDADAICAEAWVRMVGAVNARVVRVNAPDTLAVRECRFESGHTVIPETQFFPQPYSVLLSAVALAEIFPPAGEGLDRHVIASAADGWAVVADLPSSDRSEDSARTPVVAMLETVSRRLLARLPSGYCRFPSSAHLESLAEFAAGAGHEINNPLGTILGQSAALLRTNPTIEQRQAIETIGGQAWRIRDMIGNTMLFARPPALQRTVFDPGVVLIEVVDALGQDSRFRGIPVHLPVPAVSIRFDADRTQFATLLSCLLRNALEATVAGGGTAPVQVSLRLADNADVLELSVTDSGPGLGGETIQRHLFDPFFSGRPAGRGLGFGLSLAWQIVRQHNGMLFCHSPDTGGLQLCAAVPKGDILL